MGRSERRALQSRLEVSLLHLPKWQAQPERRGRTTWRATIKVQRLKLDSLLRDMPSLKNQIPERLLEAYRIAIFRASAQTHLPETAFPGTCPFSIDQVLDEGFFPE